MENLAISIPYLSVGKNRKLAGGDGLTYSPFPHQFTCKFIFSLSSFNFYPSLCFLSNFPSFIREIVEGAQSTHPLSLF